MSKRRLAIYLRDHLAAALGGFELSRRTLRSNRGTPFQATLEVLAVDIAEDRDTLRSLMASLGIRSDPVKEVAVWTFEKVARLKLNGNVLAYSPLSRLVELEVLGSGIEGKRSMWSALRRVAEADHRLDPRQLERLEQRAVDQRALLEVIRLEAARLALLEPLTGTEEL